MRFLELRWHFHLQCSMQVTMKGHKALCPLLFVLVCLHCSSFTLSSITCPDISPEERLSCYQMWRFDFTEDECEQRGCCYSPSVETTNWCYYPHKKSDIKYVHVVQGCHFDAGFSATVYDIINLWFVEYFSRAYRVGEALANDNSTTARLQFTAQSWLVSLYQDCPDIAEIQCPSQEELAVFHEAIQKGYLTYHAFPFNSEPELFDSTTFQFGVELTHMLDATFGKPKKRTLSQRDVPGLTQSVIPLLVEQGVSAISVGVNGGSTGPNVPHAFIWHDPASGKEIKVFYVSGGYSGRNAINGEYLVTTVPGSSHAMILDWRGDNTGPPLTPGDVVTNFKNIQEAYPGAQIRSSTFDEFLTAVENEPNAYWPVISEEIGDTWIHGAASDPLKLAKMRVAQRLRSECVLSGKCSNADYRFFNFSRLFLKNGEHTWGLDCKKTIPNAIAAEWTNNDLQKNLPTPDFEKLVASWVRQRQLGLEDALKALEDHPLADKIESEWADLSNVKVPNLVGYTKLTAQNLSSTLSMGNFEVVISRDTGSIIYLRDKRTELVWVENASGGGAGFGLLEYHTYDGSDYVEFLTEYNYLSVLFEFDDWYDFDKAGIDFGGAEQRTVVPKLASAWLKPNSNGTSTLQLSLIFPEQLHRNTGTPGAVWISIVFGDNISFTVQSFNKTATRLPEAMFLRFVPESTLLSGDGFSWTMEKMGEEVDPSRVVLGGNRHLHGVSSGGISLKYKQKGISFLPADSPLVCWGSPTPFPTPLFGKPDIINEGASFLLWDNIWNTNYIMWYPFVESDKNSKWRYTLDFTV